MEITSVRVVPVQDEKLKAFVSIVLDSCFVINDLRVIQGRDGLFVSMPSRRLRNGSYKDIAHPLNQSTREWLESRVLEAYRSTVESSQGATSARDGASSSQGPAGPEAGVAATLEEIERKHLDDAYWGVR